MKKFFFVAVSVLCATLISTAQSTHLGVKAGLNVGDIKVINGTDFEGRAGFYAGGLAHIHITRYFAVQPEIIYSSQGGKIGDLTRRQDYINLPVLAQYMTNNGFRLQTGPQVGFLILAKDEVGKVQVDVKDQLKTADLSWVVGASYLSKIGLGVDARYNFGITNINETESPKTRNMVFQVGAFYQFSH